MKHRWIAALAVALVLALGACAPPGGGQGGESTPSPSVAPSMESDEAGDDNPDDYGY